jgi:Tol biopolymer transport system component
MADLRVAFTEIKEETDSGHLPASPASSAPAASHRRAWIAAIAATLVFAALVVWQVARRTPPQTEPTLEPIPLTNYPGDESTPTWSPDGSQFAFVWNGEHQDNLDIYVQSVGSNAPLRLTTDTRNDFAPTWSPDGRYIAFLREIDREAVSVQLVSPLGGPERRIGQFFARHYFSRSLAGMCWSADSKFLLVSGGLATGVPHGIYRLEVGTGDVTPLATINDETQGYVKPALSFDGRTLAMLHLGGQGSIVMLPLSSAVEAGGVRNLDTSGFTFSSLAWTADGRHLIAAEGGNTPTPLYRVSLAGGAPETLPWSGAGVNGPAVSPSRRRLAFARMVRDTNIYQASLDRPNRARPELQKLASSSFREVAPQFSPDGKRLAFHSNRSGSVQIWTADADGSRPAAVTSMDVGATTGTPRWSPDGQSLAFDSTAGGNTHIYVIAADGGRPRALTHGSSQNYVAAWSHDGHWIYFTSTRSGNAQVWRVASAGGEPEQITHDGGEEPTISPDGEWLYFTRADGANGLWKMPVAGGAPSRVVENLFRYNYAVGTAGVYWMPPEAADHTSSVRFRDAKTGATNEILKVTKPVDLGLALSPDGRTLLFTQVDYSGQDLMLVENFR